MRDDRSAILAFFNGVMDRSPIPVIIYNFPRVPLLHNGTND